MCHKLAQAALPEPMVPAAAAVVVVAHWAEYPMTVSLAYHLTGMAQEPVVVVAVKVVKGRSQV